MYVIDSSALAKYVNREPGWEQASGRLAEGCITLELAVKETANSLWKRVMRKDLNEKIAATALKELVELRPFKVEAQEPLYRAAFRLAVERETTFYDALFVELAIERKLPLVTSDARQAAVALAAGANAVLIE